MGHQAHIPLVMSTLSFCCLVLYLLQIQFTQNLKYLCTACFCLYMLPLKYFGLILMSRNIDQSASGNPYYMAYSDIQKQSPAQDYYKPPQNEPFWKSELRAQISGLRIKAEDVKVMTYGQMRYWIIGAKDKIIECSTIISTCQDSLSIQNDPLAVLQCNACSAYLKRTH